MNRVLLANDKILARHVRSFALEELNEDFSWVMGDLLEDLQNPAVLKKEKYVALVEGLKARSHETLERAKEVFGDNRGSIEVVEQFPARLEATVHEWHREVVRLHNSTVLII